MRDELKKILEQLYKKRKLVTVSKDYSTIANYVDIKGRNTDISEVIYLLESILDENDVQISSYIKPKIMKGKLKIAATFLLNADTMADNDFDSIVIGPYEIHEDHKILVKLLYIVEQIFSSTREDYDLKDILEFWQIKI